MSHRKVRGRTSRRCAIRPCGRRAILQRSRDPRWDERGEKRWHIRIAKGRRKNARLPAPKGVTNQVRQGVTGHKVRYVLYWGLGGIVVIYAVIYFFFLK
jgi:hypothetical protein